MIGSLLNPGGTGMGELVQNKVKEGKKELAPKDL